MRSILGPLALLLSVSYVHAQESAFDRLSLNTLNSVSNIGDHVQIEHGTGKVLFTYDFNCELASRGMNFRPRVMVQPSAKTNANFNGQAKTEYIWMGSITRMVYYQTGGFEFGENNLYVLPDGSIISPGIHMPTDGVGFNFNADGSSLGSIDPGQGNWTDFGRAFSLPDGRSISIPGAFDENNQVIKENVQVYLPLLQAFGYPSTQVSRGGWDNVADAQKETCYKLESGGMVFFLKNDAGLEGYYGPLPSQTLKLPVDGIPREGWLPALVVVALGQSAYEYELLGPSAVHQSNKVEDQFGRTTYDLIMDAAGYRLRKIKNKFGDYISFKYDALDIGYTAKLFINGTDSGKAISLEFQGITDGENPPLFGRHSTLNPNEGNKVLTMALRSSQGGSTLKSYHLTTAFLNEDFYWPCLGVDSPTPWKRQKMQFLSLLDNSNGLRCDISYARLTGTLPFGPGLDVGAVGIDSIQFSQGLKYKFAYKPDLYCASFGSWNKAILSSGDYSNCFPGMSWGVTEVQKSDTLTGEVRTTRYDRRLPELKVWTFPFQWNSLEFWEKETFPDGSGVNRAFTSPVPGYSGRGPYGSTPDPYDIRLQMYRFKKGALESEAYFDQAGTTYKTVTYSGWENRNLYNPNSDPRVGMEAHPTSTVTSLLNEGVIVTQTKRLWDPQNIGWTQLNHTVSGPGGSFERGVSWTLDSDPAYGLFGLQQREVRIGYPAITRTFDSNGLITSEQVDGGTNQVKKDFHSVQGRIKGFTLSATGLTGSPAAFSLTYDHDAYGYLNKIQAGNGLLTYLRDYDTEGRPIQDTDPNGFTVTYQWDEANRLKGITPNGEVISQVDYPADLRSLDLTRGQSNESRKFNAFGELVSIQLPGGEKTFRYDSLGRKTFESVIAGSQGTAFCFDARGRLKCLRDPNGLATSYSYSGLRKSVNVGNETTSFTSDALGRLVSVVDAAGQTTTYGYDERDRITSVTQNGDGGSQTRTWHYNALGWLDQMVQPESGATTYSNFNVFGKPGTTSYSGGVVNTTFDALGRVTDVNSADGSVAQHFVFDGGIPFNGKLRTAADQGVRIDYGYGGLNGRMDSLKTTLTGPVSGMTVPAFSQSFTYDNYGNRDTTTLPSGRTVNYTYDLERGVLKEVGAAAGPPGSFLAVTTLAQVPAGFFNPADSPLKLVLANGTFTMFTYSDDQTRLSSMSHAYPLFAGSTGRTWTYVWNPTTGRLDGDGEDTYKYEDKLGRLTEATFRLPASQGGTSITQKFAYDPFGNQTSSTFPTGVPSQLQSNLVGWTMNASEIAQMALTNRLPGTTNGVPTGAQYDLQGNLTEINKRPGGPQVNLAYDALGRVIVMTDGELNLTEKYFYTPEGLRTRVEVYEGLPPGALLLKKVKINIYNDQRQLVTQLEAN